VRCVPTIRNCFSVISNSYSLTLRKMKMTDTEFDALVDEALAKSGCGGGK
jgi:hypothetical protein